MSDNQLLKVALGYAERGWYIFPLHSVDGGLCTCGKPDCCDQGKHPRTRHGYKDATQDATQLRHWWQRWPGANIGAATGAVSDFFALDVDDKDKVKGSESLQHITNVHGALPRTLTSITGNGRQFFFRHPGYKVKNSTSQIAPGLDVRGDGGYVVLPPSRHLTGAQYRWEDPSEGIAAAPEWLLEQIRACRQAPLAPANGNTPQAAPRIGKGKRNNELTRIAGSLRRNGLVEPEMAELLLRHNQELCTEPLPVSEVLKIAQSVARYKPAEPGANLHWMPLIISDWDGSLIVKSGTSSERGMYASLIIETWRRRGVLPDDPVRLWRLAQADTAQQFEEAKTVLLSEFEAGNLDGQPVLVHPRMLQLWEKQAQKYAQKVEAGRQSGAARRSRVSKLDAAFSGEDDEQK